MIAADPKHLGARIGITAVLHTWGSAMTHHPHVHMIVPGGGISLDGERWIATKPDFLLPVLVLSRLFRRLMLEKLSPRTRRAGSRSSARKRRSPMRRPSIGLCNPCKEELVRLREGAIRRTQAGARIPVALHASRRDLEQPPR